MSPTAAEVREVPHGPDWLLSPWLPDLVRLRLLDGDCVDDGCRFDAEVVDAYSGSHVPGDPIAFFAPPSLCALDLDPSLTWVASLRTEPWRGAPYTVESIVDAATLASLPDASPLPDPRWFPW